MLSAAKNQQVLFETRRWPEILRGAQHDRAKHVWNGMQTLRVSAIFRSPRPPPGRFPRRLNHLVEA